MAAYISKKSSWLRCLASFLPAAGVTALFCFLFAGPRLGPFYDFLLRRRPPPPISRELLLIDSSVPGQELGDDILEPSAASSLLYTMTELGARTLIIQVPILGLSAGGKAGEAEILHRFDEEFSLLSRNIRNLFDAIRTGSVAPRESARYVGELVELSDKGKERLVSALVRRDEEGIDRMERAAAFFGHVRRPGDLRVQLITAGVGGRPGVLVERNEYSRARPDRDGVLRRIAPLLTVPILSEEETEADILEHIIYGALKNRYKTTGIEYIEFRPVGFQLFGMKGGRPLYPMVLALREGPDEKDTIIPLDKNGAILYEVPHNGEDFRRIVISDFLAYDEADRDLRRLILEGEALGIFKNIEGENRPGFLYDFALALREEKAPPLTWIETRGSYFASLENFLNGPTETNLAGATETKDSQMQTFAAIKEKHNEVLELRNKLESALAGSFCILGRGSSRSNGQMSGTSVLSLFKNFPQAMILSIRSAFHRTNPTDMEASALLANSILTGRVVKPGEDIYLLLGSLLWALLTCFFIKSLGPMFTLGAGAFLTLIVGAIFSWSFILSGLWLDPFIPTASSATGVVFSFAWALIAKGRYSRRFLLAFGPFVSRSCIRSVIQAGKPLPSQVITARAAIVVIKNTDISPSGDPRGSRTSSVLTFYEKASELFKKAGGTVIGTDGDLAIACFGSPLERVFQRGGKKLSPYENNINALAAPAQRAADIVREIARRPECAPWNFGLDMGNCTFAWTALSGYFALGSPVQRARILSRLASRYQTRIVISSSVNDALPDLVAKKLNTLKGKAGGETFYKLEIGG